MATLKVDGRYYDADSIRTMEATIDRLWSALQWIDTYSPQDTAAAEARFGLDLRANKITKEPSPASRSPDAPA